MFSRSRSGWFCVEADAPSITTKPMDNTLAFLKVVVITALPPVGRSLLDTIMTGLSRLDVRMMSQLVASMREKTAASAICAGIPPPSLPLF
jgi:hypothetical protein